MVLRRKRGFYGLFFYAEKSIKRPEFPYPKARKRDNGNDEELDRNLKRPGFMERRVDVAHDHQTQDNVHPSQNYANFGLRHELRIGPAFQRLSR